MPAGYDPIEQVQINAFFNVYVPRFRVPVLSALALLLGGLAWRLRRQAARQP